ncbi:MAG: hypothetical protein KIT31_42320, partial [Deltaproteobacteria bacterium]|nr:hypothetical protein [Deltaproteobacteria bacterium]
PLAGWVATAEGPGMLLARAVLWHAGDHAAAAAGLDVVTIPAAWIHQIGLSVAEADGERLGILGPSRTTPLL